MVLSYGCLLFCVLFYLLFIRCSSTVFFIRSRLCWRRRHRESKATASWFTLYCVRAITLAFESSLLKNKEKKEKDYVY